MAAPIPLPVRQRLWQLAQQGLATDQLAARLHLSLRTVQHLLRRFRRAPAALAPAYQAGPGRPVWAGTGLREQACALRQQHPRWGAGYIRVRLRDAYPDRPLPSERTLRRWFEPLHLPAARAGPLPQAEARRAVVPHAVWQMDAADQLRLGNGQGVCWLRLVDEASGAFLQTVVSPPGLLGPRARELGTGPTAAGLQSLGPARRPARR